MYARSADMSASHFARAQVPNPDFCPLRWPRSPAGPYRAVIHGSNSSDIGTNVDAALTSTELAKMTELVADCRQEGTGKGLETLQAIASLVCDKEPFPDLDDL